MRAVARRGGEVGGREAVVVAVVVVDVAVMGGGSIFVPGGLRLPSLVSACGTSGRWGLQRWAQQSVAVGATGGDGGRNGRRAPR